MKINPNSLEQRRKRVYEFYLENMSLGKTYTVKHFAAEKISKRTIYNIIKRFINDNGIFYSSDITLTPASVKYSPTEKFSQKIMVWIAFSSKGISKPVFF